MSASRTGPAAVSRPTEASASSPALQAPGAPAGSGRSSGRIPAFLALAYGWAAVVGGGLWLLGISLHSGLGLLLIALLYMPAPAIAALIVERERIPARLRLPRGQGRGATARYFLLPALVVVAFTALLVAASGLLGNLLGVPGVGALVKNTEQLRSALASLIGPGPAARARLPESVAPVAVVAVLSSILAGWTVNGVLALGEEYGWRGFLWEQLRPRGVIPANLAIGLAWGLWHAPLILQGYDYGDHRLLGLVAMVAFATAASFVLTAIRELTGSVLPAAAAHGAINGIATFLALLLAGADPLVGGPIGVLGAACLGLLAIPLWAWVGVRSER